MKNRIKSLMLFVAFTMISQGSLIADTPIDKLKQSLTLTKNSEVRNWLNTNSTTENIDQDVFKKVINAYSNETTIAQKEAWDQNAATIVEKFTNQTLLPNFPENIVDFYNAQVFLIRAGKTNTVNAIKEKIKTKAPKKPFEIETAVNEVETIKKELAAKKIELKLAKEEAKKLLIKWVNKYEQKTHDEWEELLRKIANLKGNIGSLNEKILSIEESKTERGKLEKKLEEIKEKISNLEPASPWEEMSMTNEDQEKLEKLEKQRNTLQQQIREKLKPPKTKAKPKKEKKVKLTKKEREEIKKIKETQEKIDKARKDKKETEDKLRKLWDEIGSSLEGIPFTQTKDQEKEESSLQEKILEFDTKIMELEKQLPAGQDFFSGHKLLISVGGKVALSAITTLILYSLLTDQNPVEVIRKTYNYSLPKAQEIFIGVINQILSLTHYKEEDTKELLEKASLTRLAVRKAKEGLIRATEIGKSVNPETIKNVKNTSKELFVDPGFMASVSDKATSATVATIGATATAIYAGYRFYQGFTSGR